MDCCVPPGSSTRGSLLAMTVAGCLNGFGRFGASPNNGALRGAREGGVVTVAARGHRPAARADGAPNASAGSAVQLRGQTVNLRMPKTFRPKQHLDSVLHPCFNISERFGWS